MTPAMDQNRYRLPQVAIFIETSSMYGRELLKGIGRYIRQHDSWEIFMEPQAVYEHIPRWTQAWQGDGIISRLDSPESIACLRGLHVPVVDLNDNQASHGFPTVRCDHRRIGCMAGEYLLGTGLTRFAALGSSNLFWSRERLNAFRETLERASCSCDYFDLPFDRFHSERPEEEARFHEWLRGLVKPVAFFACYDMHAIQLLNACHRLGIHVPGELSLLSVGNEDVVSEFCYPSLSTIGLDPGQIGYLAASQLDRMMKGQPCERETVEVAPTSLILRDSTNRQASEDTWLTEAMTLIRQHATKGLTVDQLAKMLCVSRSTLQRRFQKVYGRTVHDFILETRLEKAKLLLRETDLSCFTVAMQCGFENETYFYYVFKKQVGITCRQFRRET